MEFANSACPAWQVIQGDRIAETKTPLVNGIWSTPGRRKAEHRGAETMEEYVGGKHEISDVAIARRRSQQRGRRVVVGAFGVMFVVFGIINSFAPFFASLQEAFTAQRGAIALIYSIAAPLYFLLGLISGPLADRFGPRRVALIGVMVGAAGLLFAAQATALWQIYLGFGVGVGSGVGFAYVPAIAAVQRWYLKGRGTASGLAVAGIGLGTLAMPLVAAPLISWLGWRGAWSVFAVLMIGGGGGAALLLDRGPERYGWLPDGGVADPSAEHQKTAVTGWSIKEVIRSRPFCLLYVGLVFASVGAFVPFVHLVP